MKFLAGAWGAGGLFFVGLLALASLYITVIPDRLSFSLLAVPGSILHSLFGWNLFIEKGGDFAILNWRGVSIAYFVPAAILLSIYLRTLKARRRRLLGGMNTESGSRSMTR